MRTGAAFSSLHIEAKGVKVTWIPAAHTMGEGGKPGTQGHPLGVYVCEKPEPENPQGPETGHWLPQDRQGVRTERAGSVALGFISGLIETS